MEPVGNDGSDSGQAWAPARATNEIREIARSDSLNISYRLHAKEQMADRDLIVSDVLYVLKNGFVYEEPVPATRGYFRYAMENKTPNSDSRRVRVIVIPDKKGCLLKIVTVMWVDEQ